MSALEAVRQVVEALQGAVARGSWRDAMHGVDRLERLLPDLRREIRAAAVGVIDYEALIRTALAADRGRAGVALSYGFRMFGGDAVLYDQEALVVAANHLAAAGEIAIKRGVVYTPAQWESKRQRHAAARAKAGGSDHAV